MIQSKQDLKFYIAEDRKRNLRADSNMSKFQYFLRKIYGNENVIMSFQTICTNNC